MISLRWDELRPVVIHSQGIRTAQEAPETRSLHNAEEYPTFEETSASPTGNFRTAEPEPLGGPADASCKQRA